MKILISAEPQGFGFASTAKTIASYLKGHRITFLANDLAYTYFEKEGGKVFFYKGYHDITFFKSLLRKHDIFLSVNESKLAIMAKRLGARVIFFDLLFWLWQNEMDQHFLHRAFDLYKRPLSYLLKVFSQQTNRKYDLTFIRHRAFLALTAGLIADQTFIQDFPPLKNRKKNIYNKNKNVHYIHPIIRKTAQLEGRKPQRELLISLGGIPSQNHYAQIFAKAFSQLKKQISFHLASSDLHAHCDFQYKLYKQKDLHEAVLNSEVALIPPGFTTMLEIFSLKRPVIYLPPKNAGVHKMCRIFREFGLNEYSIRWEDIYPVASLRNDSWGIMRMAEKNMLLDKALPTLLNKKVSALVHSLLSDQKAQQRLIRRQTKFLNMIMSHNGHFEVLLKDLINNRH